MKSPNILFVLAFLLFSSRLMAQESVNSAGGNASGTGGSVSFSIGQVLYATQTGSGGSEAQGVQQAFEIFTVGNKDLGKNLSLSVFPNPAVEALVLQTDKSEKLKYQLLDMNGKLLSEASILETQTRIDMAGLPSATYLVKVLDQNQAELQTFKIIKK